MKRSASVVLILFLSLTCIAAAQQPASTAIGATEGATLPRINPLQIALLHWYPANRITQFAVGWDPVAMAFDGASLWVSNVAGANVTRIRTND